MEMSDLLSVCLGLGLAAACGFRVFVPLLVTSVAASAGYLQLSSGFEWVAGKPALICFATATVLEIAAYYVPWVDNLLDSVSGPAAVVAGSVVAASSITEIDPFLKWTLAIIGGGGLAGVIKGSTSLLRGASTLASGGLANPILSTAEAAGAFLIAVAAIVVPVVAFVLVVAIAVFCLKKMFGWLSRRRQQPEST